MQDFGTRHVAFGFSFGVPVALSAPNSELRTQTPDRRLEDGPTRWLRHVPGTTLDVKKGQTLDFAPRQIANDKKVIKMRRFSCSLETPVDNSEDSGREKGTDP